MRKICEIDKCERITDGRYLKHKKIRKEESDAREKASEKERARERNAKRSGAVKEIVKKITIIS
jgi:hypothetical protein